MLSAALNLPQMAAGQPLPIIALDGLPTGISGLWGLFEVRLQAGIRDGTLTVRIPLQRRGYISVFLSAEGKLFLPTARHIWDLLQTAEPQLIETQSAQASVATAERLQVAAEQAGQALFNRRPGEGVSDRIRAVSIVRVH